jgi:hypothetical protein
MRSILVPYVVEAKTVSDLDLQNDNLAGRSAFTLCRPFLLAFRHFPVGKAEVLHSFQGVHVDNNPRLAGR